MIGDEVPAVFTGSRVVGHSDVRRCARCGIEIAQRNKSGSCWDCRDYLLWGK